MVGKHQTFKLSLLYTILQACGKKWDNYSTIAPFYHIRAKERAKYATLLHSITGQKYGLKRNDKMAAQNEPNLVE